jgi:hypothetical protein
MRFTNLSDGTGESLVKKVDAAAAANGVIVQGQTFTPGVHLKVRKIDYALQGMGLNILFDATSPASMLTLGGQGSIDMTDVGGIQNPGTAALTGSTGSLLFSTINAALNASYAVVLHLTKGVPNS